MTNSSVELFKNLQISGSFEGISSPIIVADNLRTPENMGLILRLAANVNACVTLFLSDNDSKFKTSKIKRTSSGASEKINWKIIKTSELMSYIPEDYTLIALETSKDSKSIFSFRFPKKSVIIVGNEVLGIQKKLLDISQCKVHIPVPGKLSSLNVTHALSIALFTWFEQNMYSITS